MCLLPALAVKVIIVCREGLSLSVNVIHLTYSYKSCESVVVEGFLCVRNVYARDAADTDMLLLMFGDGVLFMILACWFGSIVLFGAP